MTGITVFKPRIEDFYTFFSSRNSVSLRVDSEALILKHIYLLITKEQKEGAESLNLNQLVIMF